MKTWIKFIIGCVVFVGIVCGVYFLSLFLANRIILFFLWFLRVNAMEGTTMYEVYYAYGMNRGYFLRKGKGVRIISKRN